MKTFVLFLVNKTKNFRMAYEMCFHFVKDQNRKCKVLKTSK